jgi:hypothetical protein
LELEAPRVVPAAREDKAALAVGAAAAAVAAVVAVADREARPTGGEAERQAGPEAPAAQTAAQDFPVSAARRGLPV